MAKPRYSRTLPTSDPNYWPEQDERDHWKECPKHEDSCLSDGDCICDELDEDAENDAADRAYDLAREEARGF